MLKWENIREYIKSHKFYSLVLALLIFVSISEVVQFTLIARNYGMTRINSNEIQSLHEELGKKEAQLASKIDNAEVSLNSRVDILDSSIKINEKKKMLIKKIRDAITENTSTQLDVRTLNRIAIAVIDYGYTYNLSIAGLLAQLKVESNFNPEAVSVAGAQGLGQIMPDTREHIMLKTKNPMLNPWDVNDSIYMTCVYMAELKTKFGNWEDALRAYNTGPNNVRKVKAGLQDYVQETKDYVPKILEWNEKFKRYGLE